MRFVCVRRERSGPTWQLPTSPIPELGTKHCGSTPGATDRHYPTNVSPCEIAGSPRSRGSPAGLGHDAGRTAILYEVMANITVYTTDPCSFCRKVKGILDARGVQFTEVNLTKDPEGRVELAQRTGMMTFPQVTVDGRLLGGYAELQAAADAGRLDELLAA